MFSRGTTARLNAGSQSTGVLILHSCASKLLVSVTLFFLAYWGTLSCLGLSLPLIFFLGLCIVDRHVYQQLFLLEQSWHDFVWSLACLVAYTFNHTARGFSSSVNVVLHPFRIGSAVPAVA